MHKNDFSGSLYRLGNEGRPGVLPVALLSYLTALLLMSDHSACCPEFQCGAWWFSLTGLSWIPSLLVAPPTLKVPNPSSSTMYCKQK